SNLLSFFPLLRAVAGNRLALETEKAGGAHALLHYGPKVNERIVARIGFETVEGACEYSFALGFAAGDRLIVEGEQFAQPRQAGQEGREVSVVVGGGFHRPSGNAVPPPEGVVATIRKLADEALLYHFHDPPVNSALRLTANVEDNRRL